MSPCRSRTCLRRSYSLPSRQPDFLWTWRVWCGDRLPVPIPQVEWIGQDPRFAAYRKLQGVAFDPNSYRRASVRDRDELADSLAGFLAAMHTALSPTEIATIGIPGPDRRPVNLSIADVPAEAQRAVEKIIHDFEAVWVDDQVEGPQVPVHHDFHCANMVLDAPAGRLVGVWDFSNVQTSNGAFDLCYLANLDLVRRVARAYEATTRVGLDVQAAMIAHYFETICDYILRDQQAELPRITRQWTRHLDAKPSL
ncbi:MAG: phosphotransferase family protein [Mycobacteriales bacterium]